MINKSGLEFTDISTEIYREYQFIGGEKIKIEEPLCLNVSKSGGHRIYAKNEKSYYIPPKWICLSWAVDAGKPNFVK